MQLIDLLMDKIGNCLGENWPHERKNMETFKEKFGEKLEKAFNPMLP